VPRAPKPFFIHVVHSPPGAVGHVAALELPSQEGRTLSRGICDSTGAPFSGRQSPEPWDTWQRRSLPQQRGEVRGRGTRGSARAYLSKEARSGTVGHMAAPELTSVRRRGSELRDTWWHQSSPQQGCEVRGRGTRGGSGAHACRAVWSEATTYVAARRCIPCFLS
jgi:hypothetical protein